MGFLFLGLFVATWVAIAYRSFLKKQSAVTSIGGGFLASVALCMVLGTSLLDSSDPNPTTVDRSQDTHPLKQAESLSDFAATCFMSDAAGRPVRFRKTSLPKNSDWTEAMVCEAAGEIVDQNYQGAKKFMTDLCDMADNTVHQMGEGSYSVAIQKIDSWEQGQETRAMLEILEKCQTKESRKQFVMSSVVASSIYSIGNFQLAGKNCPGYIVETSPSEGGNWVEYSLHGFGPCSEFSSDQFSEQYFYPIHRPDKISHSAFITANYSYNGKLPETFNYKGKTYPF